MRQDFYKYVCNQCGKEEFIEVNIPNPIPEGWGIYTDNDRKDYHFHSAKCWEDFWKIESINLKDFKTPNSFKK